MAAIVVVIAGIVLGAVIIPLFNVMTMAGHDSITTSIDTDIPEQEVEIPEENVTIDTYCQDNYCG